MEETELKIDEANSPPPANNPIQQPKLKNTDEVIEMQDVSSVLIKPDSVLNFDCIDLNAKQEADLINGRPCDVNCENGLYKVYYGGCFYGVGIVEDSNLRLKAYLKD